MAASLSVLSIIFLFIFFKIPVRSEGSFCSQYDSSSDDGSKGKISHLLLPNVKDVKQEDETFGIFCYKNVDKSVFQLWRSVHLVLLNKPISFELFPGRNQSEVCHNYESKSIWVPSLFFSSSDTVVDFPAFSEYCVGIATTEKVSLILQVRTINYWKVLQTLLGIFIFLTAPTLSRNSFFHYTSGVSFGVLASLLILLYVISRFMPRRSASYAVLLFGYSFFLYVVKVFWHHFHDIIAQHMDIVLGYCIISALLSFLVCYRLGPVKSQRTCDIIQWCMQAFSLLLIFFSSEYREVSTALIMLLLAAHVIPTRWIKWIKYLWYRCFPPKIKLLTELEFIEQGNVETKKALEGLRQYCSSPDCNVWKVVRNLKDPSRFANFVETGSHYTDQELLQYNSEDFSDQEETESSGGLFRNHIGNGEL